MRRYAIPAILGVTILMAGIFAFYPIEQASTVHTTITANTDAKDQWITLTINDIVLPVNSTDIDLSEDVDGHINIAAGTLFIDETDSGDTGEVTLYCDEDADGFVDPTGEVIFQLSADGFDSSNANDAVGAACDFLRIDLKNYDNTGDSVDISLILQIDNTSD